MTRKSKKALAVLAGAITTLAGLLTALVAVTTDAATMLGTVAYGGTYRTVSGGHTNKRGLFVAAIVATVAGDGTLDTLKAWMRTYAVPAFRAELQYAVATGDAAYFRTRDGKWCGWANGLLVSDALNIDASDDALATAFFATCPPNRANVNGMLTEITLAAVKRNTSPLPVFADVVVTGMVAMFDADTHTAYAGRGYGHAVFTLPA